MKKEQISPDFIKQLETDGFAAQAILAMIGDEDPFGEAVRKIRLQTEYRYSKKEIRRALNGRERPPEITPKVTTFIDWLKNQRRRRWILEADEKQQNEKLLAKDLMEFSEGKPTDFIVWNCLGFKWQQESQGGYPFCSITSDIDTAIVPYFLPKLQAFIEKLSGIGNPTIVPMVPSNEATYESMWNYLQDRQTRELIVNSAVVGLTERFQTVQFPKQAKVIPMRWDGYLRSRGIEKTAEDYSKEGEQLLLGSTDLDRIRVEAIQNGIEYFGRYQIRVDREKIAPKRIRYYGMYGGEGAAMADIRESGRNVLVINFEEFRVSKMALRGAKGNLSIVTPITDEEMAEYYKSENEIQKSKKTLII